METETKKEEDLLDNLWRKRDEALERVIEIWLDEEKDTDEELNKALDVLTVAHATATFEHASGSFSS
jgi:hypothetical protein